MLTKRELEVLQLRKAGKTQVEIAQILKISQPAVSVFERNAHKKTAAAQELLKHLKELGLLCFALMFLPFLAHEVHAAIPNPGHAASSIGPGTFSSGNYVFPAQLDITGNLVINTSKFFVNASSGNVGIGTAAPTQLLDVRGSVNLSSILYAPQICLNGNCQTGWPANISSTNGTAGYLARFTSSTNIATGSIYDNGTAVGIGTTQPNSTLQVIGTGNISSTLYVGSTITGANGLSITGGSVTLPSTSIANAALQGSGGVTINTGNGLTGGNGVNLGGSLTLSTSAVTCTSGNFSYWNGSAWLCGAAGNVTSTANGTANYLAKFTNSTNIANGLIIDDGTNIGIGVNSPLEKLHLQGTFRVDNASGKRLFLVNASNNIVRFGDTNSNVTLLVNGTINATGTITQNSGFDLAEMFSATETMGPGDLVAIAGPNTVKKATAADGSSVIGAVSGQPGFILAKPGLVNSVMIGLAGRIPVKVTGTVNPGDFITASDTAGVGMAATKAGFVIGRALEANTNGVVNIIIQPTYFSPQVDVSNSLIGDKRKKLLDPQILRIETGNQVQQAGVAAAAQDVVSVENITDQNDTNRISFANKDVVITLG